MANLDKTIQQVQGIFNDIDGALQDKGIDTSNLKPTNYANAIRGITGETVEIGLIPVLIYTYSTNTPDVPEGGSWNGELISPTNWYSDLSKVEDVTLINKPIWMSSAIFYNTGEQYTAWTSPVRISGRDGKDGEKGEQGVPGTAAGLIQYYNIPTYCSTNTDVYPDKPAGIYSDSELKLLSDNWSLTTNVEDSEQVWWMSIAKYNSGMYTGQSVEFTDPVRISTTKADSKSSVARYYCLSNSSILPTDKSVFKLWDDNAVASYDKPYLYVYDVTYFTQSAPESGPIYLLATYMGAGVSPLIYPAGMYSSSKIYTRTEEQTPYVYYPEGLKINDAGEIDENGKECYYFILKYSYNDPDNGNGGKGSSLEEAYNTGLWTRMEQFEAVYSDIGLFKQALVGNWVFHGDYMFTQDGVLGYYTDDSSEKHELYVPSGVGSGSRTGDPCSYEVALNETMSMYYGSEYNSVIRALNLAEKVENGIWIPNIGFNAITGEGWFAGKNISFKGDGSTKIGNDTSGLSIDPEGNVTIGRLDFDSFVKTSVYQHGSTVTITPMSPNVFIEYFEFGSAYAADLNLNIVNTGTTARSVMRSVIINNSGGHINLYHERLGGAHKFIIPPNTTQEFIITINETGAVDHIYPIGGSDPYYRLYRGGIDYQGPGSKHPDNVLLYEVGLGDNEHSYYFPIFSTKVISGICGCSNVGTDGNIVLKVYNLGEKIGADNTEVATFMHELLDYGYCMTQGSFKDESGNKVSDQVFTNCTLSLSGTGSAGIQLANNVYGWNK